MIGATALYLIHIFDYPEENGHRTESSRRVERQTILKLDIPGTQLPSLSACRQFLPAPGPGRSSPALAPPKRNKIPRQSLRWERAETPIRRTAREWQRLRGHHHQRQSSAAGAQMLAQSTSALTALGWAGPATRRRFPPQPKATPGRFSMPWCRPRGFSRRFRPWSRLGISFLSMPPLFSLRDRRAA